MEPAKESTIYDLNSDMFKIIMIFIAQSLDGARDLARASCISKVFNKAARDKDVLNSVKFGERCSSEYSPSFWNTEGLVHRCAGAGTFSAKYLILENLSTLLIISRLKKKYLEKLNKEYHVKLAALEGENTMARYNVALSALEELDEITNDVKEENDEILEQFKTFKINQSP